MIREEIFYLTTHFLFTVMWRQDIMGARCSSVVHHPIDRIAHTMACVTPVVEHWMEGEIAEWVHHEESIRRPIGPWVTLIHNFACFVSFGIIFGVFGVGLVGCFCCCCCFLVG